MMDKEKLKTKIHQKAQALFYDGIAESALNKKSGNVEAPIAIHGPGGDVEAWFVGIVVNNKLVGYMRFQNDLTLISYSSFQRQPDSIKECPDAKTWIDPNVIMELAKSVAMTGDHLEQPLLSYDQHPSRIAWTVRAIGGDGKDKLIFVAGEHVYMT